MTVENIKKVNGKAAFEVDIDAAAFEAAVEKAYRASKKDIYVPGFRKGKAPRMVIEGMYGKNVFHDDAVNELASGCYADAVKEAELRTVGTPSVVDYKVTEDGAVVIAFETDLYPEVTLGQYKGIEAYKAPVEVSEDEIAAELDKQRKKNARIQTVERPIQNGDTANIDFNGLLNGEPFEGGDGQNHDLVIGSGSFIPGFEEQLVGLSVGDNKDVELTFPDNYYPELAGKPVTFKVKVNEVKESLYPELDDEFAKDVSEFDTLEEYKASIKENLTTVKTEEIDRDFRNTVMGKAVGNMTADIPESMIQEQLRSSMYEYRQNCEMQGISFETYLGQMGIDEMTFSSFLRPGAENTVKTEVLLDKVAEVEGIAVTDEETDAELERLSTVYGMELEQLKAAVDREAVAHDLKMKKAMDYITDSAIATDKPEEEEKPEAEAETVAEAEAPAEETEKTEQAE
ncbi:MAG: trigger factor [Oscillospiraceae bacterium]|nr:trigger factor [Oscillospiraceae bacterium]